MSKEKTTEAVVPHDEVFIPKEEASLADSIEEATEEDSVHLNAAPAEEIAPQGSEEWHFVCNATLTPKAVLWHFSFFVFGNQEDIHVHLFGCHPNPFCLSEQRDVG